jgi:glycosyltransferase involved in cell wall biosynthesis
VRLSIVVPFYNERHRLDRSLDAIAGQAGDDVEVILVDDGSTDGTAAALTERADVSPGVRRCGRGSP